MRLSGSPIALARHDAYAIKLQTGVSDSRLGDFAHDAEFIPRPIPQQLAGHKTITPPPQPEELSEEVGVHEYIFLAQPLMFGILARALAFALRRYLPPVRADAPWDR